MTLTEMKYLFSNVPNRLTVFKTGGILHRVLQDVP